MATSVTLTTAACFSCAVHRVMLQGRLNLHVFGVRTLLQSFHVLHSVAAFSRIAECQNQEEQFLCIYSQARIILIQELCVLLMLESQG